MQVHLAAKRLSRLSKAIVYLGVGVLLTTVLPFYFSPWYFLSWIHFVVLLAWTSAGIIWDPFQFGPLPRVETTVSLHRRFALVLLALVVLAPFIFWATKLYWAFPWLPWRSLAYRWVARELVVVTAMAVLVPIVWPALTFGRQLSLFICLCLISHLFLLLTYAGISGGPAYLQDGVTQECFLSQLQFKTITGILIFIVFRLGYWKFRAGRFPIRTLAWAAGTTVCMAVACAGFGIHRKHKQDGPVVQGKSVGYWITEAHSFPDAADPSVVSLHQLGTNALPYLMRALKEGRAEFHWFGFLSEPNRSDIRERAGQLLKTFRGQAASVVPELLECLASKDNEMRKLAAGILGTAGVSNPQVRKALLNVLNDPECQYEATLALTSLGRNDPEIIRGLAEAAKVDTEGASYWATVVLAKLGPRAKAALPVLIELANHPQSKSRREAIQAIALMAPESHVALSVLLKALDSDDSWLRKCTVIALGRIGPEAEASVPRLREMLNKEDDYTKADIARALWRIDSTQIVLAMPVAKSLAMSQLKIACRGGNAGYSFASALDLLGEIGTNARSIYPELREALSASDPLLRFRVAWALYRIVPEEKQAATQILEDLATLAKLPPRGVLDSQVHARERDTRGQVEYFAGLAAVGVLWELQPERKPELQGLIVSLMKEWDQWASYEFPPEEQVLIPPLNEILKDSSVAEWHPLTDSVLATICGSAGERW